MDASQITKLLQKQNTRYINRSQTVDSSTLIWKNQIQSSKYIKGVKTCDGEQNWNVPTNPACPVGNGISAFGGSGRTTSLQSGSTQKFLNVLSGASGSASRVYSSETILLQRAGRESCGVPGLNPAPQNSYVVLPGGNPTTSDASLQVPSCSYLCSNTNGPIDGGDVPVNNNLNPYLPQFDTYYKFKNPSAQCGYPVQDQNQKHFVKQCHSRFPNANNGVNAVFNPSNNVTRMDPDTKQFYTYPTTNPDTCDGCILEPVVPVKQPVPIGWPAFIVGATESTSYSISQDSQRVYITGYFSGSVDLYNGGVVNTTTEPPIIQLVTLPTVYDAFIACYSISGQLLWATAIETRLGGNVTQGVSVADDATGIYVIGVYDGDIDFYNGITSGLLDGTGPYVASLDILNSMETNKAQFMVKYNISGQVQWVTKVDNIPNSFGSPEVPGLTYGVCSNGSQVYVAGYYNTSTTIYNSGPTTNGSIAYQLTGLNSIFFLIQYNINGQVQWLTQGDAANINNYYGFSVTCDSNAVYCSILYDTSLGYCQTVTPSAGPYTNPTVINTITSTSVATAIISYNTDGSFAWIANFNNIGGGPSGYPPICHSMSVDTSGLYVLAQFAGQVDIYAAGPVGPPVTLTNGGIVSYIIIKYVINDSTPSNNGTISWIQQINIQSPDFTPFAFGSSISSDGTGVYVTISSDSNIDLYTSCSASGPVGSTVPLNKLTPDFDSDGFIMRYDTSGSLIWMNLVAGINSDQTTGITSDGTSLYLTGFGSGIINFYNSNGLNQPSIVGVSIDPAPNTNNYAFTAKYDINGQVITSANCPGNCPSEITNFIPSSSPTPALGFTIAVEFTWDPITTGTILFVPQFDPSVTDTSYLITSLTTSSGVINTNDGNYNALLTVTKDCCATRTAITAPCFLAGSLVTLVDGTEISIEDVKIGDKVLGAFGEINEVLALHRPMLGDNTMTKINEDHHTSSHHPHISSDKKFYAAKPSVAFEGTYGRSHPVIDASGNIVERFLSGLSKDRLLTMTTGVTLQTTSGPRSIESLETYSLTPDTQLYNLVVSGSHTYCVDGYAVTGWPSEDDFDYDAWVPK